jgi:Zn-dependent M16 (insulinase) family peptidase
MSDKVKQIDESLYGFELVREDEIPEINSRAALYVHTRTGAQLLSVQNQDENKVFGVTFTTPPGDSTGLPHIMEHSVLCGSKKYPVKEPFIELIKGSLATFINAMTFPDKTVYPVASTNSKDFYNLIDVYLDAVFYPSIGPETLQQEGWHYELASADTPLEYKGVVFNEMKGAYSSPENLLGRVTQEALYPDTTYGFDSGGDPRDIPNLTYEDFRSFHDKYYHPSNARFYFYGDDDIETRLKLLNEVLQDFDRRDDDIDSEITLQPLFDAPRRRVEKYDAGEDGDQKGLMTMSWLLGEVDDPVRELELHVLSHILLGTPASPLKKALIDSGLGEDTVGGGIDDLHQLSFGTGLKGMDPANVDQVEALIMDTLRQLASEGIDPATVEASLNTIEFGMREYNTGGFPRGLAMMFDVLSNWLYGGDPIEALRYEAALQTVKDKVAAGERVFENLIDEYLLNNNHRSIVVLEPDNTVNQQLEAEERARLDAVQRRLQPDELEQIVADTRRLHELQETPNTPEALATLPTLELDDLDPFIKVVPNEILDINGTTVLYHDLFTNGILYLDLAFNLKSVPQELLPYMSLFGRALLEMGTEKESFVQLLQRIGSKTGGIGPTTFFSETVERTDLAARFILRGKAVIDRVEDLLAILTDMLTITKFDDKERFRQIVLKYKAGREAGLIPGGHRVVARRLDAGFSQSGWLGEQTSGIENLFFLRNLLTQIENNWDGVRANLEAIRDHLLNRANLVINVTLDGENWSQVKPMLSDFIGTVPAGSGELATWMPTFETSNEGLTIPAQVNYVGKGANLYELGYTLNGTAYVVPRWLGTDWLWEKVRMMGGAYGGFASFDPYTGVFSYLSYRDPNLLGTLDNYDGAASYLQKLELNDAELTKSIIGAISDVDGYQLPDAKGYSQMLRYFIGMTDERRQKIRDSILMTTVADFRLFGEVLAKLNEVGRVVVLGSQDAIEEANRVHPGMLNVKKVL